MRIRIRNENFGFSKKGSDPPGFGSATLVGRGGWKPAVGRGRGKGAGSLLSEEAGNLRELKSLYRSEMNTV
jgi:hypothetical protein